MDNLEKKVKKYSLSIIFTVVFALIILTNFALVYVATLQHRQALIQSLINEKIYFAELISKVASLSEKQERQTNNLSLTQTFLSEMAKTRDIVLIWLVNNDSTIELSNRQDDVGRKSSIGPNIGDQIKNRRYLLIQDTYQNANIYTIVYPSNGKFIFLGFSTEAIDAPITVMQKYNSLIAMIGSFFSIFFLLLIFKTIILPLKKTTAACQEIKEGNLDARINVKSKTEIGELIATFNDMTRKLKESREREELIEKMKTEFVSLAAHQLRTPLSAIKWALRMVLDEETGKVNPNQREMLERTYQSNEKMIALINDLLNVARIEEGRFLYKPADASPEEIVDSIIDSLKDKAERKNIELAYERPPLSLPLVKMDKEKINIALTNLIANAINYTLPGGKVAIKLSSGAGNVEFSVQDNGVGIPEAEKERIFTKFFRASNVIKLDTSGTGLGMFITKNIIEAHDGKIWFESKENKGTAFHFTLPITS
ncbi:MAG: HAMP domain-containing histidine kinase [Candidatus Portnoybacteria bacterium]|nr:HAMP domain-containing histidine kinase [Candidatus Portnoybacteria bacterium]